MLGGVLELRAAVQGQRGNTIVVGWVNQLIRHSFSMILLGILVTALIAISEWSIDPRLRAENAELQRQLTEIQVQVDSMKAESQRLTNEIERLRSDPNEILYHARNGLGMVRSGEVVYRFNESRGAQGDRLR